MRCDLTLKEHTPYRSCILKISYVWALHTDSRPKPAADTRSLGMGLWMMLNVALLACISKGWLGKCGECGKDEQLVHK